MVPATVDSIIAGIFMIANRENYHFCYTNSTSIYKYVYFKTVFFGDISGDS
jgi:hypothetical protein